MVERTSKQESSPDHGSSISQPQKLYALNLQGEWQIRTAAKGRHSKRKKAPQHSPGSSPRQSDSSTVGSKRTKKARTAPKSPKSSRLSVQSLSKDSTNTAVSENRNSAFPKTPSPKPSNPQRSQSPLQSPPCIIVNDLTRASSAELSREPPDLDDSPIVSHNVYPTSNTRLGPDITQPQPHPVIRTQVSQHANAFAPYRNSILNTVSQGVGLLNLSNQPSGNRTHFTHYPSPHATPVHHTSNINPELLQRARLVRHQQSMEKLLQESQLHQQAQYTAHRTMLQQKVRLDGNMGFYIFQGVEYTLRECLLVCSLRYFCKFPDAGSDLLLSDDTIAEILHHQRGWNNPNGLDCRGLYNRLTSSQSEARPHMEASIRGDSHRWESYAWKSYWGWLDIMSKVKHKRDNMPVAAPQGPQAGYFGQRRAAHNQRLQQQALNASANLIKDGSYARGPLPRANIAAAVGDTDMSAEQEQLAANYARMKQWAASNVQENISFTSNTELSLSRMGHGFLPKMEGTNEDE